MMFAVFALAEEFLNIAGSKRQEQDTFAPVEQYITDVLIAAPQNPGHMKQPQLTI